MDAARAKELLERERQRLTELIGADTEAGREDREAETADLGDEVDPAQALPVEQVDDAIAGQLRERLAAVGRAEERLAAGTYGTSVQSGATIPDERLEADPTAELTVEEAAAAEKAR